MALHDDTTRIIRRDGQGLHASDCLTPQQQAMHDIKDAIGCLDAALSLALSHAPRQSLDTLQAVLMAARQASYDAAAGGCPAEAAELSRVCAVLWAPVDNAQVLSRD